MNDQPPMMNQPPQMLNQVMNQQPPSHMMNKSQLMNQHQSQMLAQSQAMSQQSQLMAQSQMMGQSQPMNQPLQMVNKSQAMPPPPMMNRGYKPWQPQQLSGDSSKKFPGPYKPNYLKQKRSNWKGKKGVDKRKDGRRMENMMPISGISGPSGVGGYNPPSLNELQSQNRLKARKFYPKKFNNRFAPYAPRNTSSFIIRAKKSGGIASLVSPCPVTPAVLPTPKFSPSREVLGDMAKEEWGVDGYGSMKGLIRLRSPGHEEAHEEEDEEEGGGGSSESDVEEHVEVERRLDHDLSRFEMIYPNYGLDHSNVLENRVDDQDTHIAQLEEENLTLKERLFIMEREVAELRRRLHFLETRNHVVGDANEEVVENGSENESESGGSDVRAVGADFKGEELEYVSGNEEGRHDKSNSKEVSEGDKMLDGEGLGDVCREEAVPDEVIGEDFEMKDGEAKDKDVLDETSADNDKSTNKEVANEDRSKDEKDEDEHLSADKKDKVITENVDDGVEAGHACPGKSICEGD